MDAPPVEFVTRSEVRSAVVRALTDDPSRAPALVEDLDASESAVYEALAALRDQGHAAEAGETWRLTGAGQVVADTLDRRAKTERLLRADPAYWRTHDVTTLPDRFRRTVPEVGFEVQRADDADPSRVVRLVADRMAESDRVDVLTSVYYDQYAEALDEAGEARLVFDWSVAETLEASGDDSPPGVTVRLSEIQFALAVTDDEVLLSLPTAEGEYDARTELVADGEGARDWGRRLFEHCWSRADPLTVL